MRIMIAPDSFKGSLSAVSFCDIAECTLRARFPGAQLFCVPMADGGEGTCEALTRALGGKLCARPSVDPLGRPVTGMFALLPGHTAAVEIASASGLPLLKSDERDIFRSDSGGTGLLMRDALDALFEDSPLFPPCLIVGLGGSATCDGGAGLLRALGARLLDADGKDVPEGAEGLRTLARIDPSGLDPRLSRVRLILACDVTAPLCGPAGAAAVFAPQKGASAKDIPVLDGLLRHWGDLLRRDLGRDVADLPGSGAAGGAGAALRALDGDILPGFQVVRDAAGLDCLLSEQPFDLLITGEGQLNAQTMMGKLPAQVAALAKAHGARTVAVVGAVSSDWDSASGCFDNVISLSEGAVTKEYSITHAGELLARALREREL